MSCTVTLDWKTFAVLGATAVVGVLFAKMSPSQAVEVSVKALDAFKSYGLPVIAG